jgi:hypothetical protein
MDESILDEMNLPYSSSNEDLETISENYFKPLFDVEKFEIRDIPRRDKGIDLSVELKRLLPDGKSVYLNFNFAIQLKATDSKTTNQDGSISLSLENSNINYLLNNGMPAFYVLYFVPTKTFYYESINDFARTLFEKDIDWNSQQNHTLRFRKKLDDEGIEGMYKATLDRGLLNRRLNEQVTRQSMPEQNSNKLVLDSNLKVSDDAEIREAVETIGLFLINEARWSEILEAHKSASGSVASSGMYNLILGIANYYSGNYSEALSFLKVANSLKDELAPDFNNHLSFFRSTVRYSMGLISNADYTDQIAELEDADNVGLYVKLEQAKNQLVDSWKDDPENRYQEFFDQVQGIIEHPKANSGLKFTARNELLLFRGFKKNMEYVQGVAMINALENEIGPSINMRMEAIQKSLEANKDWLKYKNDLRDEALSSKNWFAFFCAVLNEVIVAFEFEFFTDMVRVEQSLPGYEMVDDPDKEPIFRRLLDMVNKAHEYFDEIGHIGNKITALITKYEILQYLEKTEQSNILLGEVEDLIEIYELTQEKQKVEYLKENGTTHEQFKVWLDTLLSRADDIQKSYEAEIAEMEQMDLAEEQNERSSGGDFLTITLFPIGEFEFPEIDKEKVYEILNVTSEARVIFDKMFKIVIPVANIYYNPISQEGPLNGKQADKGIESWNHIYTIRKAFYENKYCRKRLS